MYLQNEDAVLLASDMRKCGVNLNVLGLGRRSPYIGREDVIRMAMVSLFCAYKKSIVISCSCWMWKDFFCA